MKTIKRFLPPADDEKSRKDRAIAVEEVTWRIRTVPDNKGFVVEIKPHTQVRYARQHNYLFGVVYPYVRRFMRDEHGKDHIEEVWHEYFKNQFLPVLIENTCMGNHVRVYRSTKKLSAVDFYDYVQQIMAWVGDWGGTVPPPDWNWREKRQNT